MFLMPGARARPRPHGFLPVFSVNAAFTVLPIHNQVPIGLGGASTYTVISGPPSAYPPGFWCSLTNQSARGKIINFTGATGASFILWPQQTCYMYARNTNAWSVQRPTRWKLTTPTTIFVDATNGNDANDGLAAGAGNAKQTIFGAVVQTVQNQWDARADSAPQVLAQLADGTYVGGLHLPGPLTGGAGHASVVINGNGSSPGNVIVTGDGAGNPPFAFFDNAVVELSNMQLQDTAAGLLACSTGAQCRLTGGILFGNCAAGQAHMQIQDGGRVIADAGYTINGNASSGNGYHINMFDCGQFKAQGQTITIGANLAFNTFVFATRNTLANFGAVTFSLGSNTVTGKRYEADNGGVIDTFGGGANFLPGNAAGSVSGGVYA